MVLRDGLTRDATGKRTDKTNKRDLTFSKWHRKFLSRKCYATDIDFLEYRIENGEIIPKALIEAKQSHVRQKKYLCSANTKAVFNIAKKLGVRFFIILYDIPDEESLEGTFWVWEVKDEGEFEEYSQRRFNEFFMEYINDELIELLEGL
ncbi:hypothetical protein [Thermococcus stetteri]|uniref:hypothetical protein n=1 Tax=Thermococcus stetteri TaxID=49900 RepID=UPI001AE2B3EE|nr:hypothetical protein [Thermococcus stetteri]MBP1911485.1 hypothetical protein [Thermococcus stetteri]